MGESRFRVGEDPMVLERLGSSLYEALRKVFRAPIVDEELVKELLRIITDICFGLDPDIWWRILN